jgi:cob(I)alamin adenosyltransferase
MSISSSSNAVVGLRDANSIIQNMKIYTKTGDLGMTGLYGGQRVSKADAVIQCIGEVDELNAASGWVVTAASGKLAAQLTAIQGELFVVGAQLASPANPPAHLPKLDSSSISRLETEIDDAETILPELRNFILPGGVEAAARLHLARAICRRAERAIADNLPMRPTMPLVLMYLNRLSDWLFVQARLKNQMAGASEVRWTPNKENSKSEA